MVLTQVQSDDLLNELKNIEGYQGYWKRLEMFVGINLPILAVDHLRFILRRLEYDIVLIQRYPMLYRLVVERALELGYEETPDMFDKAKDLGEMRAKVSNFARMLSYSAYRQTHPYPEFK